MISEPMQAFISYSHKDRDFLDRLQSHMAILKRDKTISVWFDNEISPGAEIDSEISDQLKKSDLFIALVSPDFISSSYCYDEEMKMALRLCADGKMIVVPIILEPCDWLSTPLRSLKALPQDGKPIVHWENPNDAYLDIVKSIRSLVQKQEQKSLIKREELRSKAKFQASIEIDQEFASFSKDDAHRFVEALEAILDAEGQITIKGIRKGSVIIDLEASHEVIEKIRKFEAEGRLDALGIVGLTYGAMASLPNETALIQRRVVHGSGNKLKAQKFGATRETVTSGILDRLLRERVRKKHLQRLLSSRAYDFFFVDFGEDVFLNAKGLYDDMSRMMSRNSVPRYHTLLRVMQGAAISLSEVVRLNTAIRSYVQNSSAKYSKELLSIGCYDGLPDLSVVPSLYILNKKRSLSFGYDKEGNPLPPVSIVDTLLKDVKPYEFGVFLARETGSEDGLELAEMLLKGSIDGTRSREVRVTSVIARAVVEFLNQRNPDIKLNVEKVFTWNPARGEGNGRKTVALSISRGNVLPTTRTAMDYPEF